MKQLSSELSATSDRGAILVFFIVLFGVMVLLMGLAIDGGRLFLAQRRLQRSVDAACLKGAEVLRATGNSDAAIDAAKRVAAANAQEMTVTIANGGAQVEVVLNPVPLVRVRGSAYVDILLAHVFGGADLGTVHATAASAVRPLAVVVVFDTSSSMCMEVQPNDTSSNCLPMVRMRQAAINFVNALSPELDFVGIASYGTFAAGVVPSRFDSADETPPIPPVPFMMSSAHFNRDAVIAGINSVQVLWDTPPDDYEGYWEEMGWTNCHMGLVAATAQFLNLTEEQAQNSLRVIIFMTDGSPSTSDDGSQLQGGNTEHFDKTIIAADDARAQGILIHTIGLGDELADDGENISDPYQLEQPWHRIRGIFLRRLANDQSGRTGGAPDPEFSAINPSLLSFSQLAMRGDRQGKFFYASDPNELTEKFDQILAAIRPVLVE